MTEARHGQEEKRAKEEGANAAAGRGEEEQVLSLGIGNEYWRTPDGCFWLHIAGEFKPMADMAEVYRYGLRPIRNVETLP